MPKEVITKGPWRFERHGGRPLQGAVLTYLKRTSLCSSLCLSAVSTRHFQAPSGTPATYRVARSRAYLRPLPESQEVASHARGHWFKSSIVHHSRPWRPSPSADRFGPNTARPTGTPRLLRDRVLGLFLRATTPGMRGRASRAWPSCPAPFHDLLGRSCIRPSWRVALPLLRSGQAGSEKLEGGMDEASVVHH